MFLKKCILFILFLIFHINYSSATDTLFLTSNFEKVDFVDFATYLSTDDYDLTIEEIIEDNRDFTPLSETDGSFYSKDKIYWVKGIIRNQTKSQKQLIIEVSDNRINEIQFFVEQDSSIIRSKVTGDYHPFDQRPLLHPSYLYPINISPLETLSCYILYQKKGETITLNTTLWERNYFEQEDAKSSFLLPAFFGFLACIICFVLLLTIFLSRKLFIYFTIYTIACLLMALQITGYGFMLVWSDYPYWNGMGYFFVGIYYLSLIQITRIYFNTKEFLPRVDTFFKISLLTISCLLGIVFFHWYLPNTIKRIAGAFGLLALSTVLWVVIGTSLYTYYKRRKLGSLGFFIGTAFCMTALILFQIEQLAAVHIIWGQKMTVFAILLDVIILLVIFTNQLRQLYLTNVRLTQDLTNSQLSAANALLEGQLSERKRLSQELHDGISINMALLKMSLNDYFKEKTTREKEIINTVSSISRDIRAFTHAIYPLNLEEETLEDAIEDLVFRIENQTEIEVNLSLKNFDETTLTNNEKHALHQTLQELFNNTLKHANASLVEMKLLTNHTKTRLTYHDNGTFFELANIKSGVGLKNIHARAALLDGNFKIQSDENGNYFEFSF